MQNRIESPSKRLWTGPDRRAFLRTAAAGAAFFTTRGLFAEELARTAELTEGPYYPDKLPLDTDNDLVIVNDALTPAVGEITHLSGRILTEAGSPVRNAFVEIWQVDSTASYVHTQGRNPAGNDKNFQGYGRFLTDAKGQYYFRTIKPIPYTLFNMFRTPHIHLAVSQNGRRLMTTQILLKDHPDNQRDGVFRQVRDPAARATLLADFQPLPGSKIGELTANFDVVLGRTAAEDETGKLQGGIGRPEFQRRR